MSISSIVAWFTDLPVFQQVFVGLFIVLMAIPIATLTIMQFLDSLRGLRESGKVRRDRKEGENGQ